MGLEEVFGMVLGFIFFNFGAYVASKKINK